MNIQKRKIVIIGAGHVGSHAGYALISQGLAEEIVYIDVDEKKAVAQALDSDVLQFQDIDQTVSTDRDGNSVVTATASFSTTICLTKGE